VGFITFAATTRTSKDGLIPRCSSTQHPSTSTSAHQSTCELQRAPLTAIRSRLRSDTVPGALAELPTSVSQLHSCH
jgi:hypothetical protein